MAKTLPAYVKNHLSLEGIASSRGLLQFVDTAGHTTQSEASTALGLSPGTCNLHFQKLEHMGLIKRVETRRKGRGRSTVIWALDEENNYCLSLIFDVPFFQAALTDLAGRVRLKEREDLSALKRRSAVENRLRRFVGKALDEAERTGGTVRHVVACMPGIMEPGTGVLQTAINFPLLNGIDIPRLMREEFALPASCGPLGLAFYYGEIEPLPPDERVMVIYWDLGIGAAAGVGERLISHDHEEVLLAEFGHARIERDGRACHCGRRGCLEAYVGGWALIEDLADPRIRTLDQFRNAVLDGHPGALRTARKAAELLGQNVYWSLYAMQSRRLIISGPLSVLFPAVRSAFIKGLSTILTRNEIETLNPAASQDPDNAMQRGAYRWARRRFFSPDPSI